MEYISFVCSIILCVIGVATFVVGMNTRSKNDGAMMQKLDQAIDGIEELKTDMKEVKDNQHKSDLKIQSHDDQIKTLFKMANKCGAYQSGPHYHHGHPETCTLGRKLSWTSMNSSGTSERKRMPSTKAWA